MSEKIEQLKLESTDRKLYNTDVLDTIGDSLPYLNLNSLNEEVKNVFLENYKNMVYKYYNSFWKKECL